jgi:peptidyl-prolyl cis-trans isomerase B (cyclophilin B)
MGVRMKRYALVATAMTVGITMATLPVMLPSANASLKTAAVVCKATKAVGHTPLVVKPPTKIAAGKMGKLTLVTNCGTIVIATNGVAAPTTMTAISLLVKAGYFNKTLCHRLTTSGLFVLQCGDPMGTGVGGPGFQFGDENLPKQVANNYPAGTVAMANAGPGTNGSQFFLVYADTTLASSYTIWGKITSGLNILKAIAKAGVKGGGVDGTPAKTIAIEKATIS